jgi:hypothetical protein
MTVSEGPNSITVKANSVISCPATGMGTPMSPATPGNMPTNTNSVVTITKAAIANRKSAKPCVATLGEACVDAGKRDDATAMEQSFSEP